MQVFYLVDFENVGVNGLRGIETVAGSDSIHLFSTNKGTKLDVKTLSRLKDEPPHSRDFSREYDGVVLAITIGICYNSQGKYHSRRKEKTTAQLSWL